MRSTIVNENNRPIYYSLCDYSVCVHSDNEKLHDFVNREIGEFYRTSASLPKENTQLATIGFNSDASEWNQLSQKVNEKSSKPVVQHRGSYVDDPRDALESDFGGLRLLLSSTGSITVIDSQSRSVAVYNPDIAVGAKDVRRLIRNQMCMRAMESRGALVLHGAAFANTNGDGVLVLAHRGGGKTSVFLAALANKARFLSAERILLHRDQDSILLHASPETITFFPGTLAVFPETQHLVKNVSKDNYWIRESKVRFDWRDIASCFSCSPAKHRVTLNTIVYPRFVEGITPLHVETVPVSERMREFQSHVLTDNDPKRPNWLGWYKSNYDAVLMQQVERTNAAVVEWSDYESLNTFVSELFSGL